jgi:peptide/nickel transport system ATP-binding protein
VAVMYLGQIVEMAPCEDIFLEPLHPYTRALLSSTPIPDPDRKRSRIVLRGTIPSPANPPSGCRFHTRCPAVIDICKEMPPGPTTVGGEHWAKCHLLSA